MEEQDWKVAFYAEMDARVEKNGYTIMSTTEEDPHHPGMNQPLAYTMGFALQGKPDIIAYGLPRSEVLAVMTAIAERMKQHGIELDVPTIRILRGIPVIFKKVKPEAVEDRFNMIRRYGQGQVNAIQMVMPDDYGRFPWEAGFDPSYADVQQVLY